TGPDKEPEHALGRQAIDPHSADASFFQPELTRVATTERIAHRSGAQACSRYQRARGERRQPRSARNYGILITSSPYSLSSSSSMLQKANQTVSGSGYPEFRFLHVNPLHFRELHAGDVVTRDDGALPRFAYNSRMHRLIGVIVLSAVAVTAQA